LNSYFKRRLHSILAAALLSLGMLSSANIPLDAMKMSAIAIYGAETTQMIDQWIAMIIKIRGLSDKEKLTFSNNFFNSRIKWISDIQNWQEEDYWATPLETMARRKGDCEDFSISKYITLLLAGMPDEKLRITYVKARVDTASGAKNQAHMVLAYYPKPASEPILLDNPE